MRTTVSRLLITALMVHAVGACASVPAATSSPPQVAQTDSPTQVVPSESAPATASATPEQPPGTQAPSGTPDLDPVAVEAARRVIEAADLSDPATIDEIGATLRFTAEGEWASRELLASGATADVLWAALWVYASAGSDPAPLQPLLTHDSPSLRAIAAATLIALGDAAGFDAIQEALSDDHQLLGSVPPISIQVFALQTLQAYVGAVDAPDEPTTEDDIAGVTTSWSTWLDENLSQLSYDATQGRWVL